MFDWLFGRKKKKVNAFDGKPEPLKPKRATEPSEKTEHRLDFYEHNPNAYEVQPKRVRTPRDEDDYQEEEFSSDSHKWKK